MSYDLKALIVELAEKQNFRCAFCDASRDLVREHDHYPEQESGDKITIYNLRGLVCSRCNNFLAVHDGERNGGYLGLPFDYNHIGDNEYEDYISQYDKRIRALLEAIIERDIGPLKYWRRRNFLQKFDDWREWGIGSLFETRSRRPTIRSAEEFWAAFNSCVRFVAEQARVNPTFQPPAEFIQIVEKVRPILDEAIERLQVDSHSQAPNQRGLDQDI